MRSQITLALLVASFIPLGGGLYACAASGTDEGDDGGYYVSPATTSTSKNNQQDATSNSGDDGSTPTPTPTPTPTGDDSSPTDDGGAPVDDASDDADDGGQAAAVPCAVGQTCVDLAPTGWTGYVQLRIATADAGTGSCSAPYAAVQQSGVADPAGPPATCSACTCGAPTPAVTCTSSINSGNLGCTATDTLNVIAAGACTKAPSFPNLVNGATGAPVLTSASTCTATGGTVVGTPDAATSTPAIVCALGAGDAGAAVTGDAAAASPDAAASGTPPTCDSTSQACAATIGSQAGPSGVCIYQSGSVPCPTSGMFTEQHLVGATVSDTRGCGCSCGAAACPTDGYIEAFKNTGCTGAAAATLDAGLPCVPFGSATSNYMAFKYVQSGSSSPGSCGTPDAGPTGGVTVDTTTGMTLCCIP